MEAEQSAEMVRGRDSCRASENAGGGGGGSSTCRRRSPPPRAPPPPSPSPLPLPSPSPSTSASPSPLILTPTSAHALTVTLALTCTFSLTFTPHTSPSSSPNQIHRTFEAPPAARRRRLRPPPAPVLPRGDNCRADAAGTSHILLALFERCSRRAHRRSLRRLWHAVRSAAAARCRWRAAAAA